MSTTTKDIARICNVSRTTVNRAFSGKGRISDETRQLVLNTAKELDYKPDLLATSLKKGKTHNIGVVVFDVKNQYFSQMLNAIELEAQKRDYNVNISLHEKNAHQERDMLSRMEGYRVEGIVLSPVSKNAQFEAFLKSLKVPVVLVGNRISSDIPYVGIDEKKAAIDAVAKIVSKGYKKIYFVCPPLADENNENIYSHEQRRDGFIQGIKKCNVDGNIIGTWDYVKHVKEIMKKGNQHVAFFCSGDIYALELMKELRLLHLKAGEDYGIMGFDNIDMLDYIIPRLVTIDNSVEDVASRAVEVLFDIIDGNKIQNKTIIPYQLVDGETL